MKHWIKRHWRWAAPLAAAVVGVGAWLVFGFFGLHLIFVDDKVDEPPPVFASGAGASGLPSDFITPEVADGMTQAMADEDIPAQVLMDEDLPMGATEMPTVSAVPGAAGPAEPETAEPAPATPETAEPAPATTVPQIRVAASGNFISRSHPTQGTATVLTDGIQRFLRFEDFATDNGPDLNVYLTSAPPDAPASQFDDDFIDLGDLKGNIGPQNYELSADVDLGRYSTVVVWCVRFSVAFGAAALS